MKDNKHGYTLVEAIVGAAVFSICALILVSGFVAAGSIIRKATDIKTNGEKAAAAIEGDNSDTDFQVNKENGSVSFSVGGSSVVISGQYATAGDSSGNGIYTEFIPN